MVKSSQLVLRAEKEQDKEQDVPCAILGELDRKKDAGGGAPVMPRIGAEFLPGPT
jgi:hypothetical protein